MALLKFLKGNYANLGNAAISEGQILICNDTAEMFVDVAADKRIKIGDFTVVGTIAELEALDATKVPTSRLYYVENGNILARSTGTTWVQINKQPDIETLKTQLGLAALAYKAEVAEGDLNADLVAKINAASGAQHTHDNKTVLDGITAEKVTAWDAAEKNAKDHADGLNTAMNTRVETLETKVGNDTVANQIKTEIEKLDFTDTAVDGEYVSAVNEVDGKISVTRKALPDYSETYDAKGAASTALENAKAYADGLAANYDEKGAAAGVKTELEAEIAKKVDKVEGKSLVNDSEITKLAGVSAGANKVEASETNGNIKIDGVETVVYTHPDKHSISDVTGLQDALDGKQAAGNYSVEGHKHVKADITDFAHTHTASEITDLDSTIKGYDYATKTELGNVDAKFANYKTAEAQKAIDDEQDRRLGVIEGDYLKAADIANFETKENVKKVADDLAAYVESNDEALAGVKATAEAARTEDEVNSQIDAKITALNLGTTYEPIGAEDRAKAYVDGKFTDANLAQYTTEQEVKDIVDGVIAGAVDGDTITGLANLVEYINTHGGEAAEMGAAIDILEGKVETIEGKPAYGITATQISNWDNEIGAKALAESKTTTAEVKTQIEAYGYATTDYADGKASAAQSAAEAKAAELDSALKTELQAEIDADVKVVNDAFEGYKTSNDEEVAKKANSADVYAKTETYTQDEVNSAIASAVEQACSWGSF